MISKYISPNKCKIAAIISLVVSAVLYILHKPVLDYMHLTNHTQGFVSDLTLTIFLSVLRVALFGVYILFHNNKVISKFFSVLLAADIISEIYIIIEEMKLIVSYSNYNAGMEWVKPIMDQFTRNIIIATIYLAVFLFLFIDSLKKHKFLKISRVIVLIMTLFVLFPAIRSFDYNLMYGIVSCSGFFFDFALLIYYFCIAENKNNAMLESELHRLKTEHENGSITDEEYTSAKQNILNSL